MSIAYCYALENKKLMDMAVISYSLTFLISEKRKICVLIIASLIVIPYNHMIMSSTIFEISSIITIDENSFKLQH